MGRDDNKSSSNNKNSLPQTPKGSKMDPKQVKEELANEFAEIGQKALNVLKKTTPLSTKARYPGSK